MERAHMETATRHPTVAVTLLDVPHAALPIEVQSRPGREHEVLASWVTPDGARHLGNVSVRRGTAVGAEVPIWVDDAGNYVSAPFRTDLIETYLKRTGDTDPYEALTPREREVLHLVAEGLTSGEIAGRLFISPRTAESHRANLMRKLGLRSRTDLVRFAFQRGIVPLESMGAPAPGES